MKKNQKRHSAILVYDAMSKIGHFEFEMAAIHARGNNGDNSILVGKGLKMQNSQQN